jgi:O-antigen ligase
VAAVGLGGVALLMSLSRGALLGLFGAAIVVLLLFTRRTGILLAAGGFLAIVVLGLWTTGALPASVAGRLDQIVQYFGWFDASQIVPTPQNWAVVERMAHWQAAWSMYLANPILGVGPGNYPVAYPLFRVNDFWLDPLGHAHNIYLNVMAEMGFLGITAYVVQWVAWVVLLLGVFQRSRTPFDRALACGVLASLVGVAIHNVFDNLSVHGLGTEMGILIGLCAASLPGGRASPPRPLSIGDGEGESGSPLHLRWRGAGGEARPPGSEEAP